MNDSDPLVPCRGELNFTFAWTDGEDERVLEALIAALSSVGAFFEGGAIERMDEGDVIPDSPLDLLCRGAS